MYVWMRWQNLKYMKNEMFREKHTFFIIYIYYYIIFIYIYLYFTLYIHLYLFSVYDIYVRSRLQLKG